VRLPIPLSILLVFVAVPQWSGEPRLMLLGARAVIHAERVALDPNDPARRRTGRLTFLGGVRLTSPDPTFGGFSALKVEGDRFMLLSDGGNIARFRMDGLGRVSAPSFAELPAGPGTGWRKRERDSESLTTDPASGDVLVGFENSDEIWRYDAALARVRRHSAPPAMKRWDENGGAEAMVRLADGATIVFAESTEWRARAGKVAIRFAGDPTLYPRRGWRFGYLPPRHYEPSDAALLPDGRILVLNRRFALPFDFSAKLTIVDPAAIRPGRLIKGTEIATLAAPLIHDNFEGVAVVREGNRTVLWIVSDDNQSWMERTLLLKFRLEDR
jgi:hypothetical protein